MNVTIPDGWRELPLGSKVEFMSPKKQLEEATKQMNSLMSLISALSTHPKLKRDSKELHKIACDCARNGAALYRIQVLFKN